MKLLKALKFIVLAVSVFMFVDQCSIAVQKLMEQPVVDRTEYIPIQNITKPIITICPKHELNETMLRSFSYHFSHDLLRGQNIENTSLYSWNGWNDSLTFMSIVTSSLSFDPNEDFKLYQAKAKQVYYTRNGFGLCYEIEGTCLHISNKLTRSQTFL